MRIIFDQKAKRTKKNLGWPLRIMGLTSVLVGILFLVLLHNPAPLPGAIVAGSGAYSVTLAWDPSPDTNVVGYCLYYGPASGQYSNRVGLGNVTTVAVSGLVGGVTYYFAATAIAADGQESGFSQEIKYTPALPNIRIRAGTAGQFVLRVTGLINQTYEIEATQDFKTWTIIGTVTLGTNGPLDFTDVNSNNSRGVLSQRGEFSEALLSHTANSLKRFTKKMKIMKLKIRVCRGNPLCRAYPANIPDLEAVAVRHPAFRALADKGLSVEATPAWERWVRFPHAFSLRPAFPLESIQPATRSAPVPGCHARSGNSSISCGGIQRSWG